MTPMTLITSPTPWANRGGASASSSAGGPSRGLTSQRYSSPYGEYWHAEQRADREHEPLRGQQPHVAGDQDDREHHRG
jgi:hypothetical protein